MATHLHLVPAVSGRTACTTTPAGQLSQDLHAQVRIYVPAHLQACVWCRWLTLGDVDSVARVQRYASAACRLLGQTPEMVLCLLNDAGGIYLKSAITPG